MKLGNVHIFRAKQTLQTTQHSETDGKIFYPK